MGLRIRPAVALTGLPLLGAARPAASRAGVQLFEDEREGVAGGILSHEHVEVALALEDVKPMAARGLALEPLVRPSLALRQEAGFQPAGQEDEAGVGQPAGSRRMP